MKSTIDSWVRAIFAGNKLSETNTQIIVEFFLLILAIILALLVFLLTKYVILASLKKAAHRTRTKADDMFLESRGTAFLTALVPALVVSLFLPLMPLIQKYIEVLLSVYAILIGVFAINAYLDLLNTFYEKKRKIAKQRPIKGVIRVVKIVFLAFAVIVIISKLLGQSPLIVLSGLGAMSAILLLIFKDAILGMVAGIQIAYNDIVRVGDWIEMPKYGADGDVIAITTTVVKVVNFDKTITTIPAYALVSDSFKNWRGLKNCGGRRIKRSIYIDVESVHFCNAEQLEQLEKIAYLEQYIKERQQEIVTYNLGHNFDTSCPVNGRRQTNIGIFRKYIKEYLDRHPGIHQEMIKMARQLPAEGQGLPMEVYAFTKTTKWQEYEGIMSDVFDHLYAVLPYFGLQAYQQPSGNDLRQISKNALPLQ